MKRLDYLKKALEYGYPLQRAWILSAFAVTQSRKTSFENGDIVREQWGYRVYLPDAKPDEIIQIEDAPKDGPLFAFSDRITIDKTWAPNVDQPVEVPLGNLIFNAVSILGSYGAKFPFQLGTVAIKKIEAYVAPLLRDTPADESQRDPSYIYVDEHLRFIDSLSYIKSFSHITNTCLTRAMILPPPGRDKFHAELVQKYGGADKLRDPVLLAQFDKEMMAFDDQAMKSDPAYGKFLSGSVKDTARRKLFLNVGAEVPFDSTASKVTPVLTSLDKGLPTDPEQFSAIMNGARAGSFYRGSDTVKGGVSAKDFIRALSSFEVVKTDCGSKFGITRVYTKDNVKYLAGRTVFTSKGQIKLKTEDVGNYLGARLTVRSPMFCGLNGDVFCQVCAGDRLAQYPKGLTIPVTEISSKILTASLKKFHSSGVSTATMVLEEVFS